MNAPLCNELSRGSSDLKRCSTAATTFFTYSTDPGSRKVPWHRRWPDDFRDEVLARLLELNEHRHKEEQLVGKAEPGETQKHVGTAKKARSKKSRGDQAPLFDTTEDGDDG